MKKFFQYENIIEKSPLFKGMKKDEITAALACLIPNIKKYRKGEYILHTGDQVGSVCLLLEGSAYIQKEDYWGNRNIVSKIGEGQLFAEAFACAQEKKIQVDVIAGEDAVVLFISVQKILSPCSNACEYHNKLIRNLLSIIAEKTIMINEKLLHMSQRNTKEKLMSYFLAQAEKTEKSEFDIPFNRQQLADYLSVERSAMSNAMCKLRDEGLIEFHKNHIVIL